MFHGDFPNSICPNDEDPAHGRMDLDSHIPRGYPPQPGALSSNCQKNFTDLLAKVKEIGFVQVMVSFFPAGDNDPTTWHSGAPNYIPRWNENEDLFYENWRFIVNITADLEASGLSYYIDLMNEGVYPDPALVNPTTQKELWAQSYIMQIYCRELWRLYTGAFGKDHSVGFSINVDDWDRKVANFRNIYGDCREWGPECNGPYVLSAHIYSGDGKDERYRFVGLHHALTNEGYPKENTGIIIGEAYYNDPIAASNFDLARSQTGRTIFYVLQWPILRGNPICPPQPGQPVHELRPPVPLMYFDQYLNYGF